MYLIPDGGTRGYRPPAPPPGPPHGPPSPPGYSANSGNNTIDAHDISTVHIGLGNSL